MILLRKLNQGGILTRLMISIGLLVGLPLFFRLSFWLALRLTLFNSGVVLSTMLALAFSIQWFRWLKFGKRESTEGWDILSIFSLNGLVVGVVIMLWLGGVFGIFDILVTNHTLTGQEKYNWCVSRELKLSTGDCITLYDETAWAESLEAWK